MASTGVLLLVHAAAALVAPSPPAPLRVLGIQIAPGDGTELNCRRAENLIKANPGYDLYVLPELSCNGYNNAVLSALSEHAEDIHGGGIVRFWDRVARECDAYICYGFVRRSSSDSPRTKYHICQAVASPDSDSGEPVLVYDKMHVCDMGDCSEAAFGLEPGDKAGVFDCRGTRVGVTICYDLRFPELFRRLAWDLECDLILHPSAFVRDATFHAYHHFVATRAIENGVYVLSVNYASESFGESIAAPPWLGPVPELEDPLAPSSLGIQEGVLPLTVDHSVLSSVREAYPYRRNVHETLRSS